MVTSPGFPTPVIAAQPADRAAKRSLAAIRTAWFGVVGLVATLFIAGAPVLYDQLRTPCAGASCETWQRPSFTGVSPTFYAAWYVGREVVFACVFAAVAGVMIWRAADDRMARLGAFVLVAFGGAAIPDTVAALGHTSPFWRLPADGLAFLGSAGFLLFLYSFPDGRFAPSWMRWAALAGSGMCAFAYASPRDAPLRANGDLFFVCVLLFACGAIGGQVWRYRKISTTVQRQQTKWVVFGVATAFAGLIIAAFVLPRNGPDVIANRRMFALVGMTIASAFLLLIPISIGLSMLRYRLWDVDVLINRALVYGALTITIVGFYAFLAAAAAAALPFGADPVIQAMAAGVVCLLFQPIRVRLQRRVNRLLYGERDDPYAVLSRLGQRLGGTLSYESILPTIVETVAQALKLPFAEIAMRHGETMTPAASFGSPGNERIVWPLIYGHETVGELALAPRAPGEPFGEADRRLLDDLARQAGAAVHAVRLSAELRRSRERLIGAREEERRRLRRDLHDGLGPQLASQTLTLDTARKIMPHDPVAAGVLLDELGRHIQSSILDIRRLVNALRPPVLDDLGLVAAIREGARGYEDAGLSVVVSAPALPELPAAVEVAAYRIAQEALTNVVRHAEATFCRVAITVDVAANLLRLEVEDNGRGLPVRVAPGVGLESMRERATELGGTWTIDKPRGGVRVLVDLPLGEVG